MEVIRRSLKHSSRSSRYSSCSTTSNVHRYCEVQLLNLNEKKISKNILTALLSIRNFILSSVKITSSFIIKFQQKFVQNLHLY